MPGGAGRFQVADLQLVLSQQATTVYSRASVTLGRSRSACCIEEARGYQLDGQSEAALAALGKAHEAAPETMRYNGYARRILLEEAESKSPSQRRRASELAVKVGMLAA